MKAHSKKENILTNLLYYTTKKYLYSITTHVFASEFRLKMSLYYASEYKC